MSKNFHSSTPPPVHTQKLRGQTRQGWREAGEVKESEVRVEHKTVSPLGKFLGSAGQREAKHIGSNNKKIRVVRAAPGHVMIM